MKLEIKLFAGLAEAMGNHQVTLNVPTGATVRDLRLQMSLEFPQLQSFFDGVIVAIDQTYVQDDALLHESSEVALIPPVGGGSPYPQSCLITQKPLNVSQAHSQLMDSHIGGIVLFCGTVREWTQNRRTLHLQYEAYQEMALVQMRIIETELKEQWPQVQTLQWHRVGVLKPTETAVICAAASPHREEAFTVAKVLIERLKREVPIWKKEFYENGDAVWQPNEKSEDTTD